MKTVLVCGSRDYPHRHIIERELRALPPGTRIVHGGCGQDRHGRFLWGRPDAEAVVGADMLAGAVARELGLEVCAYPPPEWIAGRFDPGAGPRRNQRMQDLEQPELVLAFVAGELTRGTRNMCGIARKAGVEVRVVRE